MCTMCFSSVTHFYLLVSSYFHDKLVFNLDHTKYVHLLVVTRLHTPMHEACYTLICVMNMFNVSKKKENMFNVLSTNFTLRVANIQNVTIFSL